MRSRLFYCMVILLLTACSAPQLIRSSNYYPLQSGLLESHANNLRYLQHHPKYADLSDLSLEGPADYSASLNYYVFGLWPAHALKVEDACRHKDFRQAYVSNGLWQGVVTLFTLGLYSPRTVEVWCGPARLS